MERLESTQDLNILFLQVAQLKDYLSFFDRNRKEMDITNP